MLHWLNTCCNRFAERTKHLPVRASAARSSGVIVVVVSLIVEIGNVAMSALRGYPITSDHHSHVFIAIAIAIAVAAAIAYPAML